MTIIESSRVVNKDGSPTSQNVGVGVVPFTTKEAQLTMKTMLNQQQFEFRAFMTQELANHARGGVLLVNEPVIGRPINDEPIPTHKPKIKEGSNVSKSNHGTRPPLEKPTVRMHEDFHGMCKYKDFMICKQSSFH